MKELMFSLYTLALILGLAWSAQATLIFEDHFNNGVLEPEWNIIFQDAKSWEYNESGTNLTVNDIDPTDENTHDGWSRVFLDRSFTALSDFHVDFDFSWESEGSLNAIQDVYIILYTEGFDLSDGFIGFRYDSNIIGGGGYDDAWSGHSGQKVADVGTEVNYRSGVGSLPLAGSASVDILRQGNNVEFYWNDISLGPVFDDRPLVGAAISFQNYSEFPGTFVGSESVDLIRVEGTPVPVPEPCTILLLAFGLIGLVGFRRGLKKK